MKLVVYAVILMVSNFSQQNVNYICFVYLTLWNIVLENVAILS
jgi:hypothetical protein